MNLVETGSTGGVPRVLEAACSKTRRPDLVGALKLLLESPSFRLRLELVGPWPADGAGWLAAVEKAAAHALESGKEFIPLLRGAESLTAAAARRLSAVGGCVVLEEKLSEVDVKSLRRRLSRLEKLGVPSSIEMLLSPRDVPVFAARLEALEPLSPAKVRFRCVAGEPWGAAAAAAVIRPLTIWLEGLLRRGGDQPQLLDVLNFWDDEEPEMLASDLRLDADGRIGWATAARLGEVWPRLAGSEPPVPLARIKSLEKLRVEPAVRQQMALRALSGPAKDLWADNVGFALRMGVFFRKPFRGFRDQSENRVLRGGLLRAKIAEQDRFLRLRLPGVKSVFYFVRSGCLNDCIFCKRKIPDPGQTLPEATAFLKENLKVGRRRIALVGNEPLIHPHILEIIRLSRRYGFEEVEVMTSGTMLADMALAKALQKAGASSFPIPLYSADPDEHDTLTGRKGSFRETVSGIENVRRLGMKVFVHTNLMRQNIHAIEGLEKLVAKEWGLPFAVLCLRPKDPDSMNLPFGALDPSYREVLDAGLKVERLVGFPVCVSRLIQGGSSLDTDALADGIKIYLLHQNFVKPESCSACLDSPHCVGTFREHLELYPEDLALLKP